MKNNDFYYRFVKACAVIKTSIDIDYFDTEKQIIIVSFSFDDATTIGSAKAQTKDVIKTFNEFELTVEIDYDSTLDNPLLQISKRKPSLFDD